MLSGLPPPPPLATCYSIAVLLENSSERGKCTPETNKALYVNFTGQDPSALLRSFSPPGSPAMISGRSRSLSERPKAVPFSSEKPPTHLTSRASGSCFSSHLAGWCILVSLTPITQSPEVQAPGLSSSLSTSPR